MIHPGRSLPELLFTGDLPDTPAITDPERTVTYRQLAGEVAQIAGALRHRGIRAGDRVAVQVPNGIDFAVVFHAVLSVGATVVPVGMQVPPRDREWQVRRAGAVLVVDSGVVTGLRSTPGTPLAPQPVDPDAVAVLPFTSGTTAEPKAILLTHRNIVANTVQFSSVLPLSAGEACMSVLPFTHAYGMTSLLNAPLHLRAHIIAEPFDAERFLRGHGEHGVALSFIAPPLGRLLADHPLAAETDFSALRTVINGAAALDAGVSGRVARRTGARVIQGYGLTEASPVTHLAVHADCPPDSIGHPLPDTRDRIVDPETGADVPPGGAGELWVRGPQVMAGYLNDPERTAERFRDGWLRTGDWAERDGTGGVRLIDRMGDVINSRGYLVSPSRLERIVTSLPGVLDCVVTRGFTADGDECPVAFVVPVEGTRPDEGAVIAAVAERTAPYERIRSVRIVDGVPRSAAGKVQRHSLPTVRLGS
ncbi:AMP-binding protein [Corynebacterium sp. P7202]|uniref:AMP-binding protein n=1 Tax=Corynebacterium pygosceleis TaxID=2800406 RepID=A0A9Q4C9E8_9CORY|nr:AMP-binding protein [Corynebacterium pygosceleis]MCK7638538.1 AMP-binding protein [Corynebacterium pygosceleis]MCX7469319.1 AMP-binding protein [Corynebacterium pygosceleis]